MSNLKGFGEVAELKMIKQKTKVLIKSMKTQEQIPVELTNKIYFKIEKRVNTQILLLQI